MNTHCNVQCSHLQFAKWLLEGSSISTPLDPGYEGGRIVAEVLDSCDSLRELCAKCGRNLTCGGLPLITCTGICQPRRDIPFKVCPQVSAYRSRLQMPSVQACRSGGLLLLLQQPCYTRYHALRRKLHYGCQNFVHRLCLAKGRTQYRCGLC